MTKLQVLMMAVLGTMILVACSSAPKNKAAVASEGEVASANSGAMVYALNTEASDLAWVGGNISGKEHRGNLNISSGSFSVEDGKIVAGNFEVDMNSLTTTDFEPEAEMYGKLVGHLKSDDFFNVEAFPKATFAITKVVALENSTLGTHSFSGNLTVRGISNELTFPATVAMTEEGITANADFTFDRAIYDVKYGSGKFFDDLGDKMIKDEIELIVNLKAAKPAM